VSDTKALYSLVADALAGQGREVQDAHAELLRRLERAEADNAALLALLHKVADCGFKMTGAVAADVDELLRRNHPGAALLEELEGLRTESERLRKERDYWEARAAFTATEAAKQVAREPVTERDAHDAALEEAAKLFVYALPVPVSSDTVQVRIRSLKKTGQGNG